MGAHLCLQQEKHGKGRGNLGKEVPLCTQEKPSSVLSSTQLTTGCNHSSTAGQVSQNELQAGTQEHREVAEAPPLAFLYKFINTK